MSQDRNENRRRQQLLKNAGYSVNIDGSWGPYQNKLWTHYLSSGLGPTKQQRIDAAKKANQKEAQASKYYFNQAPSIGNIARGVYHWYNSVPGLGGQNESGIQEYNVADNPVVASTASPTKFNPKAFIEGWKNAGTFMNKAKYTFNLYLRPAQNAPATTKAAETVIETAERPSKIDKLKRSYNLQSASLSEAEKQIQQLTENNRRLQQEINQNLVEQWKNSLNNRNFYPSEAFSRQGSTQSNKRFDKVLKQYKIPKKGATGNPTPPKSDVNPKGSTQGATSQPKDSSVKGTNNTPEPAPKKGFDWKYWLGFDSFKPKGGFGQKSSTAGKWLLNAGKLGGAYQVPAYLWDSHVQNERRSMAEAQGSKYIETPTLAWDISPIGIWQNIVKQDIEKGKQYFKEKPKATTPQEIQDYFWKQYENY